MHCCDLRLENSPKISVQGVLDHQKFLPTFCVTPCLVWDVTFSVLRYVVQFKLHALALQ